MPVGAMLSSMSSSEFAEWVAYYQIEPWGETRADLRSGIVASTIANVWRGKGKKAYSADEFIPDFEKARRATGKQSMQEQIAKARMITAMMSDEADV